MLRQALDNLRIGELAKRSGVGLQTIRYYEREGLLPKPQRLNSGYRMFAPESIHRLRFIRHAKRAGFSLDEIRKLLSLRMTPGATRAQVRAHTEAKIADIDDKIKSLKAMRRTLQKLIEGCQGSGPLHECPILEKLDKEDV